MALVLNTNINSMLAQGNLQSSGSQLTNALQQLSSGLRINTAADDAAGYAIVQGMTSQVNGLMQASRNAGDGVSLTQTAQGALTEITNDLQTMRDLAVESLNATNSAQDRADLDQQFQQLSQDIDQVGKTASFNGVKLLDGSFQGAQFQIGANAGETITVSSVNSARSSVLGQQYTASVTSGALVATNNVNLAALTINGTSIGTGTVAADAATLSSAINNAGITGVTATAVANSVTGATVYGGTAAHAGALTVNGIATASITATGVQATDVNLAVNAINAVSAATGVTASNVAGNLKLSNSTGANISFAMGGTLVAADTTLAAGTTTSTYSVNYSSTAGGALVIGGTITNSGLTAATTNVALSGTSILNSAVTSVNSSNAALASIDAALQQIAATGAQLGAYQNRFQSAISGLNTDATNLQAARSSIQDTDYAQATSNLSKAQILQQASTAMVAQANTVPQNVLTLLQKLP